jgi:putative DNA primase/helicase
MQDGNEFRLLNPHRNDRNIGSFGINMETGFAVEDARGGDLISFVAYYFGFEQHEAAAGLDQMLGIGLFDHGSAPDTPEFRPLSKAEPAAGKIAVTKREATNRKDAGLQGPSLPAPIASEPKFSKHIVGAA